MRGVTCSPTSPGPVCAATAPSAAGSRGVLGQLLARLAQSLVPFLTLPLPDERSRERLAAGSRVGDAV